MTQIIRAADRFHIESDWLSAYWLFSFDRYYDPQNLSFGPLRVFNHDTIRGGAGFPTHPHREMEIITVPLVGEMTHADSMGNRAVIRAGDVQRMSAGTGLTHSEFNLARKPVHFYQIWIFPDRAELKPSYDQRSFDPEAWRNRLCPVASGQGLPDVVTFHTDATIYRAALDAGESVGFSPGETRRVFVYVTSGELAVNRTTLSPGDRARIDEVPELSFKARQAAEFILIDVPSCKGFGYDARTLAGARKKR